MKISFIGAVVAIPFFMACNQRVNNNNKSIEKQDIILANIDTTVRPSDDFFNYANGYWVKTHTIPSDEASYGISELVEKDLREKLRKICEDATTNTNPTGDLKQIGDFWFSAMDTIAIEARGLEPLKPELDKIAAAKTREELLSQGMLMHRYGIGVFFDGGVSQDAKHSDVMAYYLMQGGLGLPNRDYYFRTDARTQKVKSQYPEFISTIMALSGNDKAVADKKAAAILEFETQLAKASRTLEEIRDPEKNYNKTAIGALASISPGIEWPKYLGMLGVTHVDSVILGQPEFFKALDKILATTDIQTIKDYMAYHLISGFAPYLSSKFEEANFNFYSHNIMGAEAQHPRWRRALDAEGEVIGEALGHIFVKEYFTPKAKARYEQMVENVRMAYKARIEKLDWMADSTKQKAIHKLLAITKKVGYPDTWKDFSAMKIDRGPFVVNMMHAIEWRTNYQLNKLGKPVNRKEWDMTPQTYNAYYNESNNEIVLPAAMMTVPGFKDEELDDALVYGYTAASTIGHEITHGFDDQGRKSDEFGNLCQWWAPMDTVQFMKRADVLVQQFNKMNPVDTLHINGRATLGENLADLGGILIGLDAFKQTETWKKGEKIHGMTQLQRFFLGYSLGWLYIQRQERIASLLLTDVHSPAKYRVNGPFPNVPDFYEAYNIKPGDKMYIADSARVHLW